MKRILSWRRQYSPTSHRASIPPSQQSSTISALPLEPPIPSPISDTEPSDWELLSAPSTAPNSPPTPPTPNQQLFKSISFDTDTFPDHAHMFASERNGTWKNETKHLLKHPTKVDWSAIRAKIYSLADDASEDVFNHVSHAGDGYDVPAMHDRFVNMMPSVSMLNMRPLYEAADTLFEGAQRLVDRPSLDIADMDRRPDEARQMSVQQDIHPS